MNPFRTVCTIATAILALTSSLRAQVGTSQVQKFEASAPSPFARFGDTVVQDADRAAVGAPESSGAVELWEFDGTNWSFAQRLTAVGGTLGEAFGSSLDLEGERLLVGAPHNSTFGTSSGAAYVFRRVGGTWLQEQQLLAFDMQNGFLFGVDVDLDGNRLVIGGLAQTVGNVPGVYVYVHDGTNWVLEQKFANAGAAPGQAFGRGVFLDGDTCFVSSFTRVWVFRRGPSGWTEEDEIAAPDMGTIGADFEVEGDRLVLAQTGNVTTAGICHAFERVLGTWTLAQSFDSGSPVTFDEFGGRISLSGPWLCVSAVGTDWAHPANPLSDSGSAFLFRHDGTQWRREAELVPDDPLNGDRFGRDVSLLGERVLCGSLSPYDGGDARGAVYAFDIADELVGTSLCAGDGGPCTPCPCANDAAAGTQGGCLNGAGRSARLIATGAPSIAADTLRFDLVGGTSRSFALLMSGTISLPQSGPCPPGSGITAAMLDGLRCIGGGVLRHGTRATNAAGTTVRSWPGALPLSAQGSFMAGETRHFQAYLRDLPTAGCGTAIATTDAVSVSYAP